MIIAIACIVVLAGYATLATVRWVQLGRACHDWRKNYFMMLTQRDLLRNELQMHRISEHNWRRIANEKGVDK